MRVEAREPQAGDADSLGTHRNRAVAAEIHQLYARVPIVHAGGMHLGGEIQPRALRPGARAVHHRLTCAQLRYLEDARDVGKRDSGLILEFRMRSVQVFERALDIHLGRARGQRPGIDGDPIPLHADAEIHLEGLHSVIAVLQVQRSDCQPAAVARPRPVVRQRHVQVLAARREGRLRAPLDFEDAALQREAVDRQLQNLFHRIALARGLDLGLGDIGAAVGTDLQVYVRVRHRQRLDIDIPAQKRNDLEVHHHRPGMQQRGLVRRFGAVQHEPAHLGAQVLPVEAERRHLHAPAGSIFHRVDDGLADLVEEPRGVHDVDRPDRHDYDQGGERQQNPQELALGHHLSTSSWITILVRRRTSRSQMFICSSAFWPVSLRSIWSR